MPINKLALIRYKTIDACLQNTHRRWTLSDLVEACSSALEEFEGIGKGVSLRTIQLDIQNMRSEKLGYNAPIVVIDKKYYTYAEKGFSITHIPLSNQEMKTLKDVLGVLQQLKGFSFFQEVEGMITRLEARLHRRDNPQRQYIDFEKNELLKGLEHIQPLLKAITEKKVLGIYYQSFKGRKPNHYIFHPFLLKEFRNRWFLLGRVDSRTEILLLALDRMIRFEVNNDLPYAEPDFDTDHFFDDVIGVTKGRFQKPSTVVLKVAADHAPYLLTKPLHRSQTLLKEDPEGYLFSMQVVWNFELEREILGFGELVQVLSPKKLALRIRDRLNAALKGMGPEPGR